MIKMVVDEADIVGECIANLISKGEHEEALVITIAAAATVIDCIEMGGRDIFIKGLDFTLSENKSD